MEKYNGNQKGFIYVSCDTKDQEEVLAKYLGPLAQDGVSFWWADSFDSKEEKTLARASAALAFLTKDYAKDSKLRETVAAAVKYNKPMLCVYVEDVELDATLSMQTEAQQALFVSKYDSDDAFIEELRKAAIFDNIQVSDQQKKKQKGRTIAAIAVAAAVLVAAIVIIRPLLNSADESASVIGVLGLGGVSQEELDSIEEIHIVGVEVVDYSVGSRYLNDDPSVIQYWDENDGAEVYTTTPGNISDLSGLEKLTNLRVLELEGQQIEDITPILKLENLEELSLSCNPVSSADGLENLKKLHRLDISDTNIRELPEGLELTDQLHTEKVYDSIQDFKGEENVWFDGNDNDITDVSNLSTAKSYELLQLEANGNETEIVKALQGIPVKDLGLAGMQINSLEELSGLKVTNSLGVAWSSITSLEGIENFEGLKNLNLHHCSELTDLTPINRLKSIEAVGLSDDMLYLADQLDDRIEIVRLNN